jgi:hypothetical protein
LLFFEMTRTAEKRENSGEMYSFTDSKAISYASFRFSQNQESRLEMSIEWSTLLLHVRKSRVQVSPRGSAILVEMFVLTSHVRSQSLLYSSIGHPFGVRAEIAQ